MSPTLLLTPAAAAPSPPEAAFEASPIALRSSAELMVVPPERAPAPPRPAVAAPVEPPASTAHASPGRFESAFPGATQLPRRLVPAPPPEVTWGLASFALAAGVGWLYERRRRIRLEVDGGAGHWASTPVVSQRGQSLGGFDPTFPEGPEIVAAARPARGAGIGDTQSRREATLVDLHDLHARLEQLRPQCEFMAAAGLLEQHLADFRYSSPWVFLELRELYLELDQREDWELVRDVFRARFGQNAPQWSAPSTAAAAVADDGQLCADLLRKWPRREARLFILRWMLGDAQSRQKNAGPPQLPLGVYRDMLRLDSILDHVIAARAAAPAVLAEQV